MNRVQVLTSEIHDEFVTKRPGFDVNQNGKREFLFREGSQSPGFKPIEFYESVGDDTVSLVHVMNLADTVFDAFIPSAVGDIDGDGLTELVMRVADHMGQDPTEISTRVYENAFPNGYPLNLVWQAVHTPDFPTLGGEIADTDNDGEQEVVILEQLPGSNRLAIYESTGNNSLALSYSLEPIPDGIQTLQSIRVLDDLDGDGWDEIVVGGVGAINGIVAVESTGDDAYHHAWSWEFSNPSLNVEFITDAMDLDGDGRKEFLAGGGAPLPLGPHYQLLESTGDDQLEIVFTFSLPSSAKFLSTANIADVDGDGHHEIVIATGSAVEIWQNTGDNAWQKVWNGTGGTIQDIGVGDFDEDGKDEIVYRTGSPNNGSTSIWEIAPAFQADMDSDNVVDVIDNCPTLSNPGQEDTDGDSIGDLCDNCNSGPNPDQGSAPVGQVVLAADKTGFAWGDAIDAWYVRGALSNVDSYTTDSMVALPQAQGFNAPDQPASGAGYYYVVRPDCAVGSWQTTIGSEPARDTALP
jgi:hypothetical protein